METTNRRRLLTAAVASSAGIILTDSAPRGVSAALNLQAANLGQTDAPAWSFALRSLTDPYTGKLQFPAEIASTSRVIQAEVIIINASDQPLDFAASNVHLLDSEGVEYAAGSAQGTDPKLVSQTLPDGERSRGHVWFIVPNSAELAEIKFYAPAPQLRVRITGS
jgi:hypothetical protein